MSAWPPVTLQAWAVRHGVPAVALAELGALLGVETERTALADGRDEAYAQSAVRLEAPGKGVRLFRNNVGALRDDRGRLVRYGLANDSAALNEKLKSADLIGWRRLLILPHMVGTVVAQFLSRECKAPGWVWSGTEREEAQAAWAALVVADGGDARFTTGPGTL